MAIKQIQSDFSAAAAAHIKSYVMDSASDAASLPKCAPGSTAMVAAKDGPIYMVNASGEWEEL